MEQIQLSQLQEDVRSVIAAVQRSDKSVLISDKGEPLVKSFLSHLRIDRGWAA